MLLRDIVKSLISKQSEIMSG